MIDDAVYALYPEVKYMIGEDAFDQEGNIVQYDLEIVKAKEKELMDEIEAKKQAIIDARQSALNKLMALGLTEEEALALGVK